jgi:hypothetical protein
MKSYKKYLVERFGKSEVDYDDFDDRGSSSVDVKYIDIPYTFKDNQIFVANQKIADVVPNESVTFINDDIQNEIEKFFEIGDWEDSKEHEDYFETIEVQAKIGKVDGDSGNVEDFKVFWHKIDVTEVLSKNDLEKIESKINDEINRN